MGCLAEGIAHAQGLTAVVLEDVTGSMKPRLSDRATAWRQGKLTDRSERVVLAGRVVSSGDRADAFQGER
ncbi:hypothetical protein ACWD26_25120 [Streptomyces sp. NPDC002787]